MVHLVAKTKPPYNNRKEHAVWKRRFAFLPVLLRNTETTQEKIWLAFYEERTFYEPTGSSIQYGCLVGGHWVTERRSPNSLEVFEVYNDNLTVGLKAR